MTCSQQDRKRDQCPKCGRTMCQQFDDKPGPGGMTISVPNGNYKCYWCGAEELQERASRILLAFYNGEDWTSEEMCREYHKLKAALRALKGKE